MIETEIGHSTCNLLNNAAPMSPSQPDSSWCWTELLLTFAVTSSHLVPPLLPPQLSPLQLLPLMLPLLRRRLGIHGHAPGTSYYSLMPHPGWRVLVLDAYDVSVMGWPEGHPLRLVGSGTASHTYSIHHLAARYGWFLWGQRDVIAACGVHVQHVSTLHSTPLGAARVCCPCTCRGRSSC